MKAIERALYRGKHTDTGEWVYGNYRYSDALTAHFIQNIKGPFPVDPETVGQWTGLEDKNGVKIFEGDLLRLDTDKVKYAVAFSGGSFFGLPQESNDIINQGNLYNRNWLQFEVIGNIHDNE